MTLQDELNRAESRWLEAERNGTHYDAVYWRGVMDGIKIQIEKTEPRHVLEELAKIKLEVWGK